MNTDLAIWTESLLAEVFEKSDCQSTGTASICYSPFMWPSNAGILSGLLVLLALVREAAFLCDV
jgi:hypothetical protein